MVLNKISVGFFVLSFMISVFSYGQQLKLTQSPSANIKSLKEVVNKYQILELDLVAFKNIKSKDGHLSLKLDLGKDKSWELELEEYQLLSLSGEYRLLGSNNEVKIPNPDIQTYHGFLSTDQDSKVAVTIAGSHFSVYVSDSKGSYVLEPLSTYDGEAKQSQFVLYDIKDIHEANIYECKKSELLSEIKEEVAIKRNNGLACFDVELAIAVDHLMYAAEGSNVGNVLTSLAAIYNLVSMDFDNEFNHQLNIRIKEVVIASCVICDPWSKTTNVGDALDAIKNWGEQGGFNETYDIGIYWTTKVYDDNFAGLAYQDQICDSQRYIAVRRYTSNNQSLRIMMSHEIGHSFGSGHNYEIGSACENNPGRAPKIMDPIVDPASVGWTNGTQSCDLNSAAVINAKISSATCLDPCATITCSSITNLNVGSITQGGISASWTGTAGSYLVRLKEEGAGNYIHSATTTASSISINASLQYCKQYHLSVKALCGGANNPAAITEIVEISGGTEMEILYVEPQNCDGTTYDLEVVVSYQNTVPGGFRAVANGNNQVFSYTSSPQTVTLVGLSSGNNSNATLEVYGTSNSGLACRGLTTYVEPNSACDIVICENFNSCELPYEWVATSSNSNVFSENYEWKFNDGDRTILNYGAANNASTTKTINGTCAAYFDDDIFMNSDYSGSMSLVSRAYDLTNLTDVTLELDYNFHKFEEGKMTTNSSQFSIDLFNGTTWTNVMFDDNDTCPWFAVWTSNCITNFVMDISAFQSDQFKVRLNYTDGNSGAWTGMIMIDNFKVKGAQLPVLDLKIIDFQGELKEDVIELDWKMELDDSFSHYVIDRSSDGQNFEYLGELKKGSQYYDNQPFRGPNYYKLKVYDKDGGFIASDMIMIENDKVESLTLYPNPANVDEVTLINTTNVAYNKLKIFSINGKQVGYKSLVNDSSSRIDISDLRKGIYLIQLSNETNTKTLRLVRL